MRQVVKALDATRAAQLWAQERIGQQATLRRGGESVTIREVAYGQVLVEGPDGFTRYTHVTALETK